MSDWSYSTLKYTKEIGQLNTTQEPGPKTAYTGKLVMCAVRGILQESIKSQRRRENEVQSINNQKAINQLATVSPHL